MSADARARLRARQGELVRSLVAGGQAPAAFDAKWRTTTARSLLNKRSRGVARSWPLLARALGEKWRGLFADFAAGQTPSQEGSYVIDGARFAEFLARRGELPDEGKLERFHYRLSSRRMGFWFAFLFDFREVAVGVRAGPLRLVRVLPVGPRRAAQTTRTEGIARTAV